MLRKGDLTQGGITGTLLHFTLPMMVGSFLQQCYNIADTLIVGQCIGAGALAAVGSAYTLMVFLISVLLGLAMGSGTVFSQFVCTDRYRDIDTECSRFYLARPYSPAVAGPARHIRHDAQLLVDNLLRYSFHLYL